MLQRTSQSRRHKIVLTFETKDLLSNSFVKCLHVSASHKMNQHLDSLPKLASDTIRIWNHCERITMSISTLSMEMVHVCSIWCWIHLELVNSCMPCLHSIWMFAKNPITNYTSKIHMHWNLELMVHTTSFAHLSKNPTDFVFCAKTNIWWKWIFEEERIWIVNAEQQIDFQVLRKALLEIFSDLYTVLQLQQIGTHNFPLKCKKTSMRCLFETKAWNHRM